MIKTIFAKNMFAMVTRNSELGSTFCPTYIQQQDAAATYKLLTFSSMPTEGTAGNHLEGIRKKCSYGALYGVTEYSIEILIG